MRILITGKPGMLWHDLDTVLRASAHEAVHLSRHDADLSQQGAIGSAAGTWSPEVIVHAAAYTDVDGCERDPEKAWRDNVVATENVAGFARTVGAHLVYVSTDYVFDGSARSPVPVSAPVGPVSVYGRTKLEGEEAVRRSGAPFLIVRTSWVFGTSGWNFVEAIRNAAREREHLRVVDDQRGTPTYTVDLAGALLELALRRVAGVLHLSNSGECTRYEWAAEILRLDGLGHVSLEPCRTEDVPRPARRPAYSVLDNSDAVAILGRPLPHWRDALARYLRARPWPAAHTGGA
jgi:dTDP-4-dehydrorhamnose reductase